MSIRRRPAVISQDYTGYSSGLPRPHIARSFHDTWKEAEAEQRRLQAVGTVATICIPKPKREKPVQLDFDFPLPLQGKRMT